MKKSLIFAAVATVGMTAAPNAQAALAADAQLLMGPQTGFCSYGLGTYPDNCTITAIPDGNYFAFDNDGNGTWDDIERVGIEAGADGGILLGVSQMVTTETVGGIGSIDVTWNFFGHPGNHIQDGSLSVIAGTNTIDMTGWTILWGEEDPAVPSARGFIDVGWGAAAIVTCTTAACAVGEAFTLNYNSILPSGDFAGVAYQLHMSGTIGAAPIPGAVWLFGSGLLGLVGMARRRANA